MNGSWGGCRDAGQLAAQRLRRSRCVQRQPTPGRPSDFFQKLRQSAPDAGVPLSMIELEFTSAAMEVSAPVLKKSPASRRWCPRRHRRFRHRYSNIARFGRCRSTGSALDPSLIADIESSEKARVIVQAVIQLIKGVGCEIVGRGWSKGISAPRPISCEPWAATRFKASSSHRRCSKRNSWPGRTTRAPARSRSPSPTPSERSARRSATAGGCPQQQRIRRPCAWSHWAGRSRPPGKAG